MKQVRKIFVFLMVLIALMVIITSTYALSRSIDTNDTLLDPDWQTTPYISDDPEESALGGSFPLPTDMDIQNVWLASDATTLSFRLQMYNEVTAMTGGTTREAWAQIDCDLDGAVNGANDRWVIYQYQLDTGDGLSSNVVYVRAGNSAFPLSSQNDNFGERPAAAADDDNIEWTVSQTDLGAGCQGNIRVQFHTDNANDNNDDTTILGVPFGVPTAVTLNGVSASGQSAVLPFALGVFGLIVVGTGVAINRKRKNA